MDFLPDNAFARQNTRPPGRGRKNPLSSSPLSRQTGTVPELPDGLAPSEAKVRWLLRDSANPELPDGLAPSEAKVRRLPRGSATPWGGAVALAACCSREPLAPTGQARQGTGVPRLQPQRLAASSALLRFRPVRPAPPARGATPGQHPNENTRPVRAALSYSPGNSDVEEGWVLKHRGTEEHRGK